MNRRALVALLVGLAAARALAGQTPPPEKQQAPRVVIISDKTPLMFGNEKVGELAEGTTAELLKTDKDWSSIRVAFGGSWCVGWVRTALTVPDSLAAVTLAARVADRQVFLGDMNIPERQFLTVRVKFEATDKSPSRIYFHWDDFATADVHLLYRHGKKTQKILPFGFMRRKALSTKTTLERVAKEHRLTLGQGQSRVEVFIFSVPIAARRFQLVLKDVARPLR